MTTTFARRPDTTIIQLTERELTVLQEIQGGLTSQEAADRLFISRRTVEYHLDQVYRKFGVTNRIQALNRAEALGLLGNTTVNT